jgi:DNA-binding PadR family transcriptional regulator
MPHHFQSHLHSHFHAHRPHDEPGHADFLSFVGRHRGGGRGFGQFAAGFMGGQGLGGDGLRTGRKLASADLQLLILALLAEKPSHGYELIKALEERSKGFYSPSPGMIYPALTYLEEIGYATVEAQGAKKLYQVTDTGRAHLEQNRSVIDAILGQIEAIGRKMADVRRVFRKETADADDEAEARGPKVLWLARRALKKALHDKRGCSLEEAQRIADILQSAVARIVEA